MEVKSVGDGIPKELSDKQDIQRQQTINLVLRAIADLRALKAPTKIKAIMEHTGLSRSVFAKPHIRKVLMEYGIVKETASVEMTSMSTGSSDKNAEKRLREKLRKKDGTIATLTAENVELRRECELLRGRLFLLMQREIG
jgi:DNA-binding transcriptional regulator YiaG